MNTARTLLGALATYRASRLIVEDEILNEARGWVYENAVKRPDSVIANKLTYLIECPHCVSIWAGAAIVGTYAISPKLYDAITQTLGFSAVAGVISERI